MHISNLPPPTGNIEPVWYSFDVTHKRVQEGGWTNQVTQRELPVSKEIAGVRMRLTAGGFRELHWHTANEWAFMINGNARLSVLNPDGTEFVLVFDQGSFSEDNTFLLSDWVAQNPPSVLSKNLGLPESVIDHLNS